MRRSLIIFATVAITGTSLHADALTDSLVSNFQSQGYTFIEVKRSTTQIKVEAIRGLDKVELIVDRATGETLKRENEIAEPEDRGRTGVSIRDRGNRTFVDVGEEEDDSPDDEGEREEDEHEDDAHEEDDREDDEGEDDEGEDDEGEDDEGEDEADDEGEDESEDD